MVYVDNLVVFGPNPQTTFDKIKKKVLLKSIAALVEGTTIPFLGRKLYKEACAVKIHTGDNYIEDLLNEFGLQQANSVVSPGMTSVTTVDAVSALGGAAVSLYRRGVGKCMWLTPVRPDIYYAAKELARHLQQPTTEHMIRLRRLLRYLKGTGTM